MRYLIFISLFFINVPDSTHSDTMIRQMESVQKDMDFLKGHLNLMIKKMQGDSVDMDSFYMNLKIDTIDSK